ncbi:hypothetical protein A3C96_03060 [Candidatus Uhrbacteria bacterium RIFCSPHIGHO2_02_FULL_60_10]|uniref:NYN domain-containing protein n=1 Tax=Candidatus Uhrbacteria bacterium RIFCSPHIGHO2_02_FULL_60_10 TaxID=1802392 RepID=A0A1F7U649_9BACT|nr:MAG: hypothetical protein A3C96_03060 [Candidatus Uhrbacteria bacterium RIFCSPHIGHO2_02_FULL_60_10]
MIKHHSQRVGVFIDAQNMYYSAMKLFGHKVNFGNILESAVAGRQLIRAIAYVVKATGEEQPFFDALVEKGIEARVRELQVFDSGAKKADWDVGMAVDAIRIGEILDVVVLVSGDGDFCELVDYLKHHGRQVEVIAFGETTSSKLKAAADDFIDLSQDQSRFLISALAHPRRQTHDDSRRPMRGGTKPSRGKPPSGKPSGDLNVY